MPSFDGEFHVLGTPAFVYRFLIDPQRLVTCVPYLKRHEIHDQEHFTVTLQVAVGPLQAPFTMAMEIADKNEGVSARIMGSGVMLKNRVEMEGSFTLSEPSSGTTAVTWSGSAKLGAYLRHLLGALIDRLVQPSVEQFARAVEAELTSGTVTPVLPQRA